MIRKFQFGGPGYFIRPNPLITSESIDSGTKKAAKGFNWLMGNLGKAFTTILTAGASTDFGQTSPFVNMDRRAIAKARENTRLRVNKAIEENSVYISPTSYVTAFTLGSLNPKVGAEVLSKDPRLQALGIIGDLLTFKFGPKVVKNTPAVADRVLASTGNKGAKSRVIAREMDRTFNKGIRTTPAKTNWTSYEDFRLNGLTGLLMLERNWLDRELETGNPDNMVHYDFGDHKSSFRKNNGAYVLNNQLIPGLSSKKQANYIWWSNEGPWQHSLWMFVNPKLLTPTRYISTPKTKQFLRVNDHPEKTIGQNLVAPLTIMDNEFITEGPVDLSNSSIILRDPLGWWGRVKYATSSPQQVTYPWQLSNSKYSRIQLPNGKIRLLLPSHTEAKPRQFVLDPQGNNKYYVHMKVWDDVDKKVPATMSSAEKNTLFEALYNELPDGAEILFPKSGPGYYGTRGTVAGLLHLSRDPRFTPGTKGTLQYLDKDDKTVRTFNGTSFIKKSLTDNSITTLNTGPVLRKPVYVEGRGMLDYPDYVTYLGDMFNNKGSRVELPNLNALLWKEFDKKQFVPVFLLWPRGNLKAHGLEIIRRMEQMGMDVDKTQGHLPLVGDGSIRYLITKNSELPSFIGYYKYPGYSGTYFPETGTTIIDPTRKNSTVYSMLHERNMHGTLRLLTPEMWKPYEDFLYKLFPKLGEEVTPTGRLLITYNSDGLTLPISPMSISKKELRATLGEFRKYLYDNVAYPRAKADGLDVKSGDLDVLRPYFEKAVDELTFPDAKIGLSDMNGYGLNYASVATNHPNFLKELKWLLKYAPATGTPLIFRYNEKE